MKSTRTEQAAYNEVVDAVTTTTATALSRGDFTFTSNQDGYMLYYKGKPLGGASVKLPREKPLYWRHAQANRRDFRADAEREIAALVAGNGQSRFRKLIEKTSCEPEPFRPTNHPLRAVKMCPKCKGHSVSLPAYPGDYFDCGQCGHSWATTPEQLARMWLAN